MDNESKKDYFEGIQKDLSSTCFQKCYNLQKLGVNKKCFDTCYSKYILTCSTVYETLKDYGYHYESLYAYKAFPVEDPWYNIIYTRRVSKGGPKNDSFIEYDPFGTKIR